MVSVRGGAGKTIKARLRAVEAEESQVCGFLGAFGASTIREDTNGIVGKKRGRGYGFWV